MKNKYPFVSALLAASMLPAGSVFAASVSMTPAPAQQVLDTKTNISQDFKTVPPLVKATMDKLLKVEPELKIASIQTDDSTHSVFIYMSEHPTADMNKQHVPDLSNAYIRMDSKTGELLMLNLQIKDWASASLPTISAAKEKAAQFVNQLLATDRKAILGEPESHGSGSSGYQKENKTWVRWAHRDVEFPFLINGIPVTGESAVHVGVDGAGHIVSFRYSLPDIAGLKLNKPSDVLSEEELKKRLITADSLTLNYTAAQPARYSAENGPENEHPALYYDFNFFGPIDARTGKPISMMTGNEMKAGAFQNVLKDVTLTAQGDKLPLIHTEQDAANALKQILQYDVSQLQREEQPEVAPDVQKANDRYIDYGWTNQKDTFVHVTASKKTGQVISLNISQNHNKSNNNKNPDITQEQAYQRASAMLSQYVDPAATNLKVVVLTANPQEDPPTWVDTSKLLEMDNQNKQYLFLFTELHNGVPVTDRCYTIAVDAATSNVVSLTIPENMDNVELPDTKSIISKEKAAAVFRNQVHFKLQYIWPDYFGQRAPSPILVYMRDSKMPGFSYVDALTGSYTTVPYLTEE
ncbi:hypothetical protein PP175_04650 [Aneurinibacillus sp. Ricciae_BoGa-3]|uniref:YcdB/YcdC domain-containing protein n=1 Tax=Aneurinibacillus sp. Ricciae_BoGa-3 TaxID=3022697 RepID=UPI002340CFA8|nr:YcdB/YcdC domain-containing protein [Aneurinibacillus sp. Ricciae_BoGa-3]WCK55277.1 hypothetical protein PP175_04650 [Aneurinibacillus sp. Ricciae_BoGa-3]